ncbi:MAG TPA: hypothetical protein VLA04_05270 [Verrucomicrobiae bacterium]|nr:hypothetical protein [Verrucomicrobiae bacterium]
MKKTLLLALLVVACLAPLGCMPPKEEIQPADRMVTPNVQRQNAELNGD